MQVLMDYALESTAAMVDDEVYPEGKGVKNYTGRPCEEDSKEELWCWTNRTGYHLSVSVCGSRMLARIS